MDSAARVLIVSDDDATRELLATVLTDEGYEALAAPLDQEVLLGIAQAEPNLILLDAPPPAMSDGGLMEAYQHLRELKTPLVVLSATRATAEHALEWGAADCLPKPFDLEQLLALVQRYTGRG